LAIALSKSRRSGRLPGRLGPTLLLLCAAVFFAAPLVTMARFALQNVPVIRLGASTLFRRWSVSALTEAFHEPQFGSTLTLSLKLAIGTVFLTLLLLVPTALFVHLKLPRARALVEFLTVLPYVVPPIAIVAGVAAFFRPNARWFLNSNYSLIPFYVVLALPFTYRAIDAGIRSIDVRTLVDASRNLGAGWVKTVGRVLIPNLTSALISSSFLTATVVLGEFTISSTLLKDTFPVFTLHYAEKSSQGGMALALLTLVGSTALLGVLTVFTRSRARRRGDKIVAIVESQA
jgi:putative spermidine/putrescine transport system permease protein